eukprot:Platyproteum_vivax@DN8504_c0_g1_i1.p1
MASFFGVFANCCGAPAEIEENYTSRKISYDRYPDEAVAVSTCHTVPVFSVPGGSLPTLKEESVEDVETLGSEAMEVDAIVDQYTNSQYTSSGEEITEVSNSESVIATRGSLCENINPQDLVEEPYSFEYVPGEGTMPIPAVGVKSSRSSVRFGQEEVAGPKVSAFQRIKIKNAAKKAAKVQVATEKKLATQERKQVILQQKQQCKIGKQQEKDAKKESKEVLKQQKKVLKTISKQEKKKR